jgi:hypothetical protein
MDIKLFVLTHGDDVKVYPNLTQLVKDNPAVSYFKAFRALQKSSKALCDGYVITSTRLKWKTRRHLPNKEY